MAVEYKDHVTGIIEDTRSRLLIVGRTPKQGGQGIIIFSFISKHVALEVPLQLSRPSTFAEAQILLGRDDTDSIGVSLSSTPALYADNHVSFTEDTQTNGLLDTPLEAAVDIFLPICFLEIWLVAGELERVYAAVQM